MKKTTTALLCSLAFAGVAFAAEAAAPEAPRPRRFDAEIGPAVTRLSFTPKVSGVSGPAERKNFYGVAGGAGVIFGESSLGYHRVGGELLLTARSDDSGATDVTSYFSTVLATYDYHFRLGDAATFYVGPSVGVAVVGVSVETASNDSSDSDGVFAAGLQAGFTVKCSERVALDFGYRGLVAEDAYLNKYSTRHEDIRAHTLKAAVVFRF